MKKVFGVLVILVGITGLLLSIGVTVVGFRIVDSAIQGVISSLALTIQSLDTVDDSLELVKTTIAQTNQAIETVELTADTISTTLADTGPMLDQISTVLTGTAPDSIEAVQGTIPNLVVVAGAIDNTLTTLSNFSFDLNLGPFGSQSLNLGVEYDPEQPFDESIEALGASLEGLPEQLRGLETHLTTSSNNVAAMSGNVAQLSDDINTINESVAQVIPLLDQYIAIVQDLGTNLASVQASLEAQGQNIKIGIIVLSIWFALYQIVPLYVGWTMVTSKKDDSEDERDAKREADTKPAVAETATYQAVADKSVTEAEEAVAGDDTIEVADRGEEEQK